MKDLFKTKYRLVERKYPLGYVEYFIQYKFCCILWLDISCYGNLSAAQGSFKNLTNPTVETILETT